MGTTAPATADRESRASRGDRETLGGGRAGGRAAETRRRRERLLAAASDLATEGGYDAVQMRDVAARAGVALGTLYRHYASKDQLLLAVLAEQAGELARRLALRPPTDARPADRVGTVLHRCSRALERRPRLTTAMVTALSSPEPDAARTKAEVNDAMRSIIAGALAGHEVAELDAVVRVLGYVWFSVLVAWVGGLLDGPEMGDELAAAAGLLLS